MLNRIKIFIHRTFFNRQERDFRERYCKRCAKSLSLRQCKYIHPKGELFIGDNSRLQCWGSYESSSIYPRQILEPSLVIGKNFHATRNLTIQCAGKTVIGDDVLVASDVFVIDYNHGLNPNTNSYLDNQLEVFEVTIGNGVWIGNNVVILPGVHIGDKAIIGAGSVVTKDVPPYTIAAGNPARLVKKYNFNTQQWEKI